MRRRERSQTEQLRQALAEREAQLAEAHARLAAVEGSTSLRVGRALTAAAKSPRRGLARLPRDLYRLWRGSGRVSGSTGRAKAEPVLSYEAERQEARLLSGNAGLRDERLLVAGVLSGEAQATIDPHARVLPLRPHDAQVTFDATDVDLLLVTASAAAPGGTWAHVGDPAVADRTRVLRWVLESASARGIPSVLVLDGPCPPALRALGFDHLHHGDLGVPLHRCHPVAADPERAPGPVFVSGNGRHAAATRPDAVAQLDRLEPSSGGGWDALAERLRHVATAVTDDPATAVRALACGVRVLLLTRTHPGAGEPRRDHAELPGLTLADARDDAASGRAVAALAQSGALSAGELRAALRAVFRDHATCGTLTALLRSALPDHATRSLADPASGRAVTVLAHPRDEDASRRLAEALPGQTHPPAALVVPQSAQDLRGIRELAQQGVPVRAVADLGSLDSADPSPADWARLAESAPTPWVALWHGGAVAPDHLGDLVCAAECSGAEAVGPELPPWRASDPDPVPAAPDELDAGRDYVFTQAVRPALARRTLVAQGTHPGVWSRHGARLLALADAAAVSATGTTTDAAD